MMHSERDAEVDVEAWPGFATRFARRHVAIVHRRGTLADLRAESRLSGERRANLVTHVARGSCRRRRTVAGRGAGERLRLCDNGPTPAGAGLTRHRRAVRARAFRVSDSVICDRRRRLGLGAAGAARARRRGRGLQ